MKVISLLWTNKKYKHNIDFPHTLVLLAAILICFSFSNLGQQNETVGIFCYLFVNTINSVYISSSLLKASCNNKKYMPKMNGNISNDLSH